MTATKLSRLRMSARRAWLLAQGMIVAGASLVPIMAAKPVSAASVQLTSRKVSSTTGVPGASTQLVFTFNTPTKGVATNVAQIELEFCDAPLSTCAVTHVPTIANATPSVTLNGTWAGTSPTASRGNGRNGGTNNQITITVGTPGNENNKSGLTITLGATDITNFNTANSSYYPRIRLYSDAGTTEEWYGAVAQSTSQTLTVNARVQEVLQFCIGTTTVDSATSQITNNSAANVTSCGNADGTSVDIGSVDSSHISITPVSTTTQGDNRLAYAMVQTNAQNGVIVGYQSVQESSSGKLKVVGATCSGTATTDQCFNSAGTSQTTFTAGQEKFGMTIAGVNCANVGTNYTCNYSNGQSNLQPKSDYFQPGSYVANTSGVYQAAGQQAAGYLASSTENFAWDDTGTYHSIAGSDTASLKVVANEAIMLKFAATSQITTPTGLYSAQADFIATPTF